MDKSVAVITARGGSKRIPRKNIKEFCGKPIIAYSIEAALESQVFDEVMVSTDSGEIADIARQYGAMVPFMRSEKNSNDYAVTADVLLEVLEEYVRNGYNYEYACCIYPTAPFVTGEKLRAAMETLLKENADTVMPVTAFSFPPQRGLVIKNGKVSPMYPEHMLKRSQDLPRVYHDCGQFYCLRVDSFLRNKSLMGQNTVPIIVNELEVQDIDNETDWRLAEVKFRMLGEISDMGKASPVTTALGD